jgi:NADP-dependent 3-hydroxy acid dehydrogenase YdfG
MTDNRVALITGGGTGIGAAIAEELARAGVCVVINGLYPEPLEDVANRIRSQGGRVVTHVADVTDFEAMEQVVQQTMTQFGRLDLLVPNAAVHDVSNLHDGDPAWWRRVIDTNVIGLLHTIRAALPHMLQQGFGHVIVIASLSGRVTYVGEPIYITSKHAQVAFVECLRQEVTPKGIKVTVVEPGMVDTSFTDNPFARELKKTVTPLEADDVARAVRFIFEQPANVVVNELSLRPAKQLL